MNKRRRKKLKWLRRLRQMDREIFESEGAWPARHQQRDGSADEWLVSYRDGTVELFWRDPKGWILGTGKCASITACELSQFGQRVMLNRPDPGNVSQLVRDAFERGYFVVPAVLEGEVSA